MSTTRSSAPETGTLPLPPWQTPAFTKLSLRAAGKPFDPATHVRSGAVSDGASHPTLSAAPSDDKSSPSGDGLLVSTPTQPNKYSPAGDGLTVSYP